MRGAGLSGADISRWRMRRPGAPRWRRCRVGESPWLLLPGVLTNGRAAPFAGDAAALVPRDVWNRRAKERTAAPSRLLAAASASAGAAGQTQPVPARPPTR